MSNSETKQIVNPVTSINILTADRWRLRRLSADWQLTIPETIKRLLDDRESVSGKRKRT